MSRRLDVSTSRAEIGPASRSNRVARAIKEILDVLAESPAKELGAMHVALKSAVAAVDGRFMEILAAGPHYSDKTRGLTIDEAAVLTGLGKRWLYRHAHELPFAFRPSPGLWRFDESGAIAWMRNRGQR